MVSHWDAIKYYSKKERHYPITDMYMWIKYVKNNARFKDEYITLAEEMINKKFAKEDQDCEYCVKYFESLRRLREESIFNNIPVAEELFFLNPKVNKEIYEPNQKWHFLFAWYGIKYIISTKSEELRKWRIQTRIPKIDFSSEFNMNHVKCKELFLWMYEAAFDNDIIKKEDLYELFYEAIKYDGDGSSTFMTLISTKVMPKIKNCIEKNKN